jgi:hypothetical protein
MMMTAITPVLLMVFVSVLCQPNNWRDAVAPATWSNSALVLVGIGATIAALCSLRVISRQAQSMRYQTTHLRDSVIEAKKAADAAKKSADTYEQTVRLTERADVLLDGISIVVPNPGFFNGDEWVVMKFKNFGRTRANNTQFVASVAIPASSAAPLPPPDYVCQPPPPPKNRLPCHLHRSSVNCVKRSMPVFLVSNSQRICDGGFFFR